MDIKKFNTYTEETWRNDFAKDQMATDKLSEGIKQFALDGEKLEKLVADKMNV